MPRNPSRAATNADFETVLPVRRDSAGQNVLVVRETGFPCPLLVKTFLQFAMRFKSAGSGHPDGPVIWIVWDSFQQIEQLVLAMSAEFGTSRALPSRP